MTQLTILLFILLLFSCGKKSASDSATTNMATLKLSGKTVLYIDSYHESYAPNMKTRLAFEEKLKEYDITIHYQYLNAKKEKSDSALHAQAAKTFELYNKIEPDIDPPPILCGLS